MAANVVVSSTRTVETKEMLEKTHNEDLELVKMYKEIQINRYILEKNECMK